MIEAYPKNDGTFALHDAWPYPKHGSTYTHRAKIKAAGGRWNPAEKCWTVREESLESLKPFVTRMRKARVAAMCHEPEQITYVSEQEIAIGRHRTDCPRCDSGMASGMTTEILEVLE